MMTGPQAMSVTLYAIVGFIAAWIAREHFRRAHRQEGSQLAGRAFALFWGSLSIDAAVGAIRIVLASEGMVSAAATATFSIFVYLTLSVMMWGILFYLVYLFTGRDGWAWPLGALYAAVFAVATAYTWQHPGGADAPSRWGISGAASAPASTAFTLLLGVGYLLPPIIGSLTYASLIPKLRGAERYRVALVSGGIFVWFVVSLILALPGAASSDAVQAAGRLVTLASILCVVAAYAPPLWVQRRYGIRPFEAGIGAPRRAAAQIERAALALRIRELV